MFDARTLVPLLGLLAACSSGSVPSPTVDLGDASPGCPGDSPQIIAGASTGYATCGVITHRVLRRDCPSRLPHPVDPAPPGPSVECQRDGDCTAHPHGHCEATGLLDFIAGRTCFYGCVSDTECGTGKICECGSLIGACVPSSCQTDRDCASGQLCASGNRAGCDRQFACQPPDRAACK
jgi:Cys-rich repeat protein